VRLGDAAQRALLTDVIAGTRTLALAHGEPDSRYALSRVATVAAPVGDGWRLTGVKSVALNADSADLLVVSARVSGAVDAADGVGLFLVDAAAQGVARRGYGGVEGSRAAEVTLSDAPAAALGEPGRAFPVLEETLARGALALSAEAVGVMEVCKDMTLDYLKSRKQFGRAIGSFQALQHRMVDMVIEIEMARSAVMLAAGTLEGDRLTRERNVAAAKHLAGRVGRLVAEESIQLHGGIAMTWDYALPHYAKRLVMIDHLLGDTDTQLERFIALGAAAA
jgi:alkylation response protein AidB-like acyl-CoA dehydrogenase